MYSVIISIIFIPFTQPALFMAGARGPGAPRPRSDVEHKDQKCEQLGHNGRALKDTFDVARGEKRTVIAAHNTTGPRVKTACY